MDPAWIWDRDSIWRAAYIMAQGTIEIAWAAGMNTSRAYTTTSSYNWLEAHSVKQRNTTNRTRTVCKSRGFFYDADGYMLHLHTGDGVYWEAFCDQDPEKCKEAWIWILIATFFEILLYNVTSFIFTKMILNFR